MLKEIAYYLRLYPKFFKANVKSQMEYRFGFLLGMGTAFFMQWVNVAFIWIVLERFHALKGWTLPQVIFLFSLRLLAHFPHLFFCMQARDGLDSFITGGTLDRFLVRPINPLYHILVSKTHLKSFTDFTVGSTLFFISSSMLEIHWTALNILFLIFIVISGTIIETAVFLIVSVVAFWTMEAWELKWIINNLSDTLNQFPLEIYGRLAQYMMTFIIPLAFMNYYPATYFLKITEKTLFHPYFAFLTPVIAGVFWLIAYSFWKVGINNYQGAGS